MIDRLSFKKAAGLKVKKGRPSIGRMPEKSLEILSHFSLFTDFLMLTISN